MTFMTGPHAARGLADEDYLLLTTFRRTGEPVPTPVWVAEVGGQLAVSTPDGTGKLKRLQHTSRVTVQACGRRGSPKPGAALTEASATVSRAPETRRQAEAALQVKYGWQWRAAILLERLLRRGRPVPRVVILVDVDTDDSRPDQPGADAAKG